MTNSEDLKAVSVPFMFLDNNATVPQYAYEGDAATDLCSTIECVLQPFERILIPCGFSLALPHGYAGFVLSRSGLASKHGVTVLNAPGLIDSNYRGEIAVSLINLDPHEPFSIHKGDRIAQLAILPIPLISYDVVSELKETVRGEGGFGSSGINNFH